MELSEKVVLVEGSSDKIALEALARRRGRNLDDEGVSVVAIGGAQAVGRFVQLYEHATLAGLCDAGQEGDFRRALEPAGFGSSVFVCVEDLEDELIRSLGAASVETALDAHGDLGSFRTLQKQPEWRGQSVERQLRRFMGSGSRRKIRYAQILVDALDLARVPRPLDGVLARV